MSQSRKFSQNNQLGSQSLVEEPKSEYENYFCFFQTASNNPSCELVLDSSHMTQDESLLLRLTKNIQGHYLTQIEAKVQLKDGGQLR